MRSSTVATERLVAAAKTVQVWYDYQAKTPVVLSADLKERLLETCDPISYCVYSKLRLVLTQVNKKVLAWL